MRKRHPLRLSRAHHPDCVVMLEGIDVLSAFNVAAEILRPDNLQERAVLWTPEPDAHLDQVSAQAAERNHRAFFTSFRTFDRRDIIDHLMHDPRFSFTPENGSENLTAIDNYISTNKSDDAAYQADFPHIDGIRNGIPDPHTIRAIRNVYGSVGQGKGKRAAGTILYEGILDSTDVDYNGRVLGPGIRHPQGTEKLGQAWQVANPRSILFVNIGGPVQCQIPHMAQVMVDDSIDPDLPTFITRVVDNFDFDVKL